MNSPVSLCQDREGLNCQVDFGSPAGVAFHAGSLRGASEVCETPEGMRKLEKQEVLPTHQWPRCARCAVASGGSVRAQEGARTQHSLPQVSQCTNKASLSCDSPSEGPRVAPLPNTNGCSVHRGAACRCWFHSSTVCAKFHGPGYLQK